MNILSIAPTDSNVNGALFIDPDCQPEAPGLQNTLSRLIGRTLRQPINPILEAARPYQAEGLAVIPCHHAQKVPVIAAWQRTKSDADAENLFRKPDLNIGIVCGSNSENLVVIDCETQEDFYWVLTSFLELAP